MGGERGLVVGRRTFNPVAPNSTPPRLVNSRLVSLPPVGILNLLSLIFIVFLCNAHFIIFTWNLRGITVNYLFLVHLAVKSAQLVDQLSVHWG